MLTASPTAVVLLAGPQASIYASPSTILTAPDLCELDQRPDTGLMSKSKPGLRHRVHPEDRLIHFILGADERQQQHLHHAAGAQHCICIPSISKVAPVSLSFGPLPPRHLLARRSAQFFEIPMHGVHLGK